MKYLLLIYENEASWAGMSEADQGKMFAEYLAPAGGALTCACLN
ncbi:MAG TPA: hypothetical protein VGQ33_00030 [Vicinamibacteria bacterium]|nr:hypothetical protein [Vicinamibacteria bacterium]